MQAHGLAGLERARDGGRRHVDLPTSQRSVRSRPRSDTLPADESNRSRARVSRCSARVRAGSARLRRSARGQLRGRARSSGRPTSGPGAADAMPPAWTPGEKLVFEDVRAPAALAPAGGLGAPRRRSSSRACCSRSGPATGAIPRPPFFDEATQRERRQGVRRRGGKSGRLRRHRAAIRARGHRRRRARRRAALGVELPLPLPGSGFRGDFRISDVTQGRPRRDRLRRQLLLRATARCTRWHRARDATIASSPAARSNRPDSARGLAWRQFQKTQAETDYRATDEVFVYLPGQRKVRRAPPQQNEGVYVPSYTRGRSVDNVGMTVNDQINDVGNPAMSAAEPMRRGFVGLMIRPNAYIWQPIELRDVLAPANGKSRGFPSDDKRNYGPSGLSLASDRWELRRAVVLRGERKDEEGTRAAASSSGSTRSRCSRSTGSRRRGTRQRLRGRHLHRSLQRRRRARSRSGKAAARPSASCCPSAQSFAVAGQGGGWLRESYALRTDPPDAEQTRDYLSTQGTAAQGEVSARSRVRPTGRRRAPRRPSSGCPPPTTAPGSACGCRRRTRPRGPRARGAPGRRA